LADNAGAVTSAGIALGDFLAAACSRAFPGRGRFAVVNVTEISEGWECDVYAFTLHSEEAGSHHLDRLILRVYYGPGAAVKCSEEFAALRELQAAGYPVPAVLLQDTSPGIEGKPFVIMELIEGPLLGEALHEAGETEQKNLVQQFCRLFVDLHQIDWRPFVKDPAEIGRRDEISLWLADAREKALLFGVGELDPVLDWLEDFRAGVRPGRSSVTHGDFHPWNILVRPPGEMVVIDWTNARVQDFRLDLSWTLLLAEASLGAARRNQILTEYERARGERIEDLEYFEVMSALRRAGSILISLRHGAEQLGMRPGAEAIMSGESNHLRTAYHVLRARTGITIPAIAQMVG
jgi:aminoglycoside phosphotransferase (APT) family kinase protein